MKKADVSEAKVSKAKATDADAVTDATGRADAGVATVAEGDDLAIGAFDMSTSEADASETGPLTAGSAESGAVEARATEADALADSSEVSSEDSSGVRRNGPRIRFAAIAWGAIVCSIAVTVLMIVAVPASRVAYASWLGGLTPGSVVLIAVLVLGGLMLLWGLLSVIRRAQQRRLEAR